MAADENGEEDFAAFREAMAASKVEAVIIHAVYLINCASTDKELRRKSRESLTHALRTGDAIGAAGVVLHPGSQKDGPLAPVDQARREDHRRRPRGTPTPAGSCSSRPPATKACWARDFDQIADLIERAGADKRLGLCLDSCHMFVQGYDITDGAHLAAVLDEADAKVGSDRLGAVHVNDAAAPLGSCRDRHANIGKGEMANAASPPSSPSPASRASRQPWRRRAQRRKAPTKKKSP